MDDTEKGLTQGTIEDDAPLPVKVDSTERRRLNVRVLLFLSALAALLLGRMLWPFVTALISALVLAVVAYPCHRRFEGWLGNERVAAFLSTVFLFFLVFLPVLGISVALFNSIQAHADLVAGEVNTLFAGESPIRELVQRVQGWLGLEELGLAGISEGIQGQVRELGSFLAGSTVGILSGLGGGMVQAGVALFTLFFLLRDGDTLLQELKRVIPLEDELTETLLERSGEIVYATMFGSVVVGIAQGVLGGLAFWFLDVPGALLWGAVMGVLGLIPVLGPPVIWGPAAVFLVVTGEIARGLLLAAAGMLIVGTVDNVLRATVVGDRARLHPLVVFFGALGGILLFGVVGIFLGPVLLVLSVSILEVTRAVLDPDADRSAG